MKSLQINSGQFKFGMLGAALTLALAAGASAQSGQAAPKAPPAPPSALEPKQLEGDFNKPLKGRTRVAGQPYSNMTYIQQDGDNSVKITINGDDVQAEVNGKAVPADRIVRDGDTVKIMGEDGKPIGAPIQIGKNMFGAAAGGNLFAPGMTVFGGQPENPPPVMLGVTMSEVDANVLKYLGVEESAIRIDSVRDNLPAAKAGLKVDDLIVAVNGQTPATQKKLREILRESKPGDELKLGIFRRGQKQDITVKLEKYDISQLGGGVQNGIAFAPQVEGQNPIIETIPGWSTVNSAELHKQMEAARDALTQALNSLKDTKLDTEKLKIELNEHLEKALESLKQEKDKVSHVWNLRAMPRSTSPRALVAPDQGMIFERAEGPSDQRIEQLEQRLERMEKTLDAIAKHLDEKK